jgi:hypothetical protein
VWLWGLWEQPKKGVTFRVYSKYVMMRAKRPLSWNVSCCCYCYYCYYCCVTAT